MSRGSARKYCSRWPSPGEGDEERVPGAPSGAARPLHVAGRAARHRGEDDRGQVADVDAEFQGRGAGQDVRVVVPGAVAEGPLHPFPLGAGHGADVLGGDDLVRMPLRVQLTVVVLLVLLVGRRGERPGAPVPGARLAAASRRAVPGGRPAASGRCRSRASRPGPRRRPAAGPRRDRAAARRRGWRRRRRSAPRARPRPRGAAAAGAGRAPPPARRSRGSGRSSSRTSPAGCPRRRTRCPACAGRVRNRGAETTAAGTRACRPGGVPRSRRSASSRPGRASSPASGG